MRARGLSKSFQQPEQPGAELVLFRGLDLEVASGEMVAIVGRSGAGKSSLLHLLGGLDQASAGEIWIAGAAIGGLREAERARLRNTRVGFIWQFHYLLPEFSALENVALPLLARGMRRQTAESTALQWVERVGLAARRAHRAGELSGGEQQRIAVARALVTTPAVLLADEPTGDLDEATAAELFGLLQQLCREEGLAAVLVTHSAEIATRCDQLLQLQGGYLTPTSLSD